LLGSFFLQRFGRAGSSPSYTKLSVVTRQVVGAVLRTSKETLLMYEAAGTGSIHTLSRVTTHPIDMLRSTTGNPFFGFAFDVDVHGPWDVASVTNTVAHTVAGGLLFVTERIRKKLQHTLVR